MSDQDFITKINFERFESAFKSLDDVGAVVRCEYEIEQAARRALTAIVPRYNLMKHRYLSDHLKMFRAFGCQGPIFQVAEQVKTIRNDFAHQGAEEITDKHLVEMKSQCGNGFGGRAIDAWVIQAGMWGLARDHKWSDLPNRQRFVLISMLDAAALDTLPQRIPRVVHLDHLPI